MLSVTSTGGGRWSLSAAWNGAAGVVAWKLLTGSQRNELTTLKVRSWRGLITRFGAKSPTARYMQVVAIGEKNRVLGSSKVIAVGG
ncbi:MAG: hypothetical protein JST53_02825 [Actinobacteria bacterium]|nr:hypothetical protein [Actinomycetota bacterium]